MPSVSLALAFTTSSSLFAVIPCCLIFSASVFSIAGHSSIKMFDKISLHVFSTTSMLAYAFFCNRIFTKSFCCSLPCLKIFSLTIDDDNASGP